MKWVILVFTFYGCLIRIQGQIVSSYGCPEGWWLHDTNCYKFADEEAVVYEEADAYCWSFGARLLSIGSGTEHNFINSWLLSNDAHRGLYWFTSGEWTPSKVYWEAENRLNTGSEYWIQRPAYNPVPGIDVRFRVVYVYGGADVRGYGWFPVQTYFQAFPICEMPREQATSLNIFERDFDYGQGTLDPNEVGKGPVIIQQPGNIVMIDGAKYIEFECFATGNPLPKYTWYYGDEYWNSTKQTSSVRKTLSGNVIRISDPTEDDVGSYYCQATNEYGTVVSDQGKMIMGYLGSFQNIKSEAVIATEFRGTKMDCKQPAYNPAVSFQWFKNFASNIFIWPPNPNMFVSYSGLLYVSQVQPTDAQKNYTCIVTLHPGDNFEFAKAYPPSRSSLGLLLVLSDESASDTEYGPILHTHAFPTPALKGNLVRLECIAYGKLPLTYSWHREDGRKFEEGTEISALGRVLEIPNAPLSAEGNYICTCVGRTGTAASKVISVSIEAKPYFPYPIKNMLVDPDMDVKWNCRAVARPKPTYIWFKNGRLLTPKPGKIVIRGNVLEILKVNKDEDEGMYQCGASNQHGTSFSSGQLRVLSFPPNFLRFPLPEKTYAAVGGNITIPCKVEAAPVPIVDWLRNGGNLNVLPGDLGGGRLSMDSSYGLVISPVEFSDLGVYTCKASNLHGEASSSTTLTVVAGARLIQPPASSTVNVNKTAFLYCQATSGPEYDIAYVWNFNGRPIDYKSSPEYVSGLRQNIPGLYIMNAQFKHQGVYECEVRTALGVDSGEAFLTVIGPPGPPAGVYADDFTTTSRSVQLVWTVTAAMTHGFPITSYDIEGETNYSPGEWKIIATDVPEYIANNEAVNARKRTDQRAITVENLIPNTSYRFRIRAVNALGRGQEASNPSKQVKIRATKPVIPPEEVGGGGGSVGTLTITWKPLEVSQYCGPGIGYHVYWKKKGDNKEWKKETANDEKALNEGKFVQTVGENNYYLEYEVKVCAFNDRGDGPNSTEVIVYSAEGMPVAVPITLDVSAVNGTALIAHWIPVPEDRTTMKGLVAGYRIHYYENPTGEYNVFDMDTEPDPVVVGMVSKNVYGQTDQAMIIGLTANCEQFIRVQVFNTAGYGPKGEWRRGETYNSILTAFPTHVEVHPLDEHSVKVRWRGISIKSDEESLQGYIIRVWKIQEDVRTATDYKVEKVMEAEIHGLQKHTVYIARVLGYSRAGDGAISEAVYFTVLGGSIPFDPTTTQICYADQRSRMCDGTETLLGSGLLILALLLLSVFLR